MKKTLVLLLALMPLSLTLAAENIYTWTDERGVVHFSTKPPRGNPNAEIMARPGLHDRAGANNVTENQSDEEEVKEEEVKEEGVKEENNESQRLDPEVKTPEEIAYCEALANNIKTLQSSPRVRIKRPDGEYEILDKDEHQGEIERIQKLQKELCS